MHQVTACCLYMLRKEAYEYYCAEQNEGALNFDDWCDTRRKESPQFQFWELVMSVELVVSHWLDRSEKLTSACIVKHYLL